MRISDWSSDVCSSDLGRAIFLDIADHGTLGLIQPNGLGYVVGHSADLHTDPATGNLAVLLELLDHTHGFIDRDGQRNTHEAAALRNDLGIHPDYLPGQIDQRTARVAGIYGSVCLDERQVVARSEERRVGKGSVGTCRFRWTADH